MHIGGKTRRGVDVSILANMLLPLISLFIVLGDVAD